MKLCIPTDSDAGLHARVHGHFGTAPFFTVVDTDNDAVTVIRNEHQNHRHGICTPLGLLEGRGIEMVCCHGMGSGAVTRLRGLGIEISIVDRSMVGEILGLAKDGQLQSVNDVRSCGSHGHGGGHGQHRCDQYGDLRPRDPEGV